MSANIHRLKDNFENPTLFNDYYKSRKLMKTVVNMMTRKVDMRPVFSGIVKFLAHSDILVKRLACHCLIHYADVEQDLVTLGINTLLKDCLDSNPQIRGLAIRTLSSLRQPNLVDYALKPIETSLQDRSAYVRRAAVMGCVKLFYVIPNVVEDHGFLNTLYAMIRDDDPVVVVNCVSALEEILQAEGGMAVNHHIANHLMNRISEFSEWGVVTVLKVVQKYKPRNEDEMYGIMDICDPLLKHNNSAVRVEGFNLLRHLVQDNTQLTFEVMKRSCSSLTSILSSGNAELSCLILDILEELVIEFKDVFASTYSAFFCRYNEPSYIKIRKIKLVSQIVSESVAHEVVDELGMYCTDISPQIVQTSVQALSTVARNIPSSFTKCVNKLFTLLELNQTHITSAVLISLQELDLKQMDNISDIVSLLPQSTDNLNNASGRSALYWLLGEYGEYMEESAYVLESGINTIENEMDCSVKLCLLTSTMRLFFKRPAECQDMLGRLLHHCAKDSDECVKNYAITYCMLLKGDLNYAKKIVLNDTK